MRTVKEVSELTGVSVRTLHYYDAIDLLKPTKVTNAGYRLYDDIALNRLQTILMFRELQFPLKEIKDILDSPNFNPSYAITQQIKLLELQYKHIGELISFAREIQEKGVKAMKFDVFNNNEIEQYKAEVKEKWGNTKEYQEYKLKTNNQNNKQYSEIENQMIEIFKEFGNLKNKPKNEKIVQQKVAELKTFITENYYLCTNEILNELGKMYVTDKRFEKNIDNIGGNGTAKFIHEAISVYCLQ